MNDRPATMFIPRDARRCAFTLLEAIVGVVAVAILACLALLWQHPVINMKGKETQRLSDAKQIALGLRLYASDNNGAFPSFALSNGAPGTTPLSDSNTAFAQLFPTYYQTERLFWVEKSAFCSTNPPDEVIDQPPLDVPLQTLKAGENEWAYVLELKESSDPKFPLVASGFANPVLHTYSTNTTQRGGVWEGKSAIVICVDGSGAFVKFDKSDLRVHGPNGEGSTGDIFTTGHARGGWLAPENVVVNPK